IPFKSAIMTRVMDQYVQCPFEKSHQVLASRLKFHISKCCVNCPEVVNCPFNAAHQIPKTEIEQHITVCADRIHIDIN
ncbi:hypothetical protein CBL_20251, partial [Carabus blaptoides fortunei]